MRVETTSNSYLAKADQLDLRQISALTALGWKDPTGTPVESTPEADPDGSPNFFAEFPAPVSFAAVADLAVRTISEILRLPHPGSLEYTAFDQERGAIELPRLGLRLAERDKKAESGENSSQLLLDTLKELTDLRISRSIPVATLRLAMAASLYLSGWSTIRPVCAFTLGYSVTWREALKSLPGFCATADVMDSLLQEEFGGQTAFPESTPSSMKH